MRIAILLMLSILASGNALAEWKTLGSNDKGATTIYADPATVGKDGDKVKLWTMIDFRKAAELSDKKKFLSWKARYEFDCKTRQSRMLAASMHSGNMGAGEITNSLEFASPDWEAVPPDSNGETLWIYACASRYPSEQEAQQHCPGDAVVWLNLGSGMVHRKGQHWYGRTKTGAYVCEGDLAKEKARTSQTKQ